MKRKKLLPLLGGISLVLILVAACAPAAPTELEVITYRQPWVATGDDAPWFVGRDKGFFAEEGIDIRIPEGKKN